MITLKKYEVYIFENKRDQDISVHMLNVFSFKLQFICLSSSFHCKLIWTWTTYSIALYSQIHIYTLYCLSECICSSVGVGQRPFWWAGRTSVEVLLPFPSFFLECFLQSPFAFWRTQTNVLQRKIEGDDNFVCSSQGEWK